MWLILLLLGFLRIFIINLCLFLIFFNILEDIEYYRKFFVCLLLSLCRLRELRDNVSCILCEVDLSFCLKVLKEYGF